MKTYSLCFDVPGLPKTANSLLGAHWRTRSAHADLWTKYVHFATFNRRPVKPLKRAVLTLTRFSSVEPDQDGLVSTFKAVIDALVKCKILENDRKENIGAPDYQWEKARPGKGFIRVRVDEDGASLR